MVKEIRALFEKYRRIAKNYEYVTVSQVTTDLSALLSDARIKRIPKHLR